MVATAEALASQVYMWRSLRNTPQGIAFDLQNRLGTGTVTRVHGLRLDGEEYAPDRLSLHLAGRIVRASADGFLEPGLLLAEGATLGLLLEGVLLPPGAHQFSLRVATQEIGELELNLTDIIAEGDPERVAVAKAPPGPGRGLRPIKVAILGAGSSVFARQLMADLLCTPNLDMGVFALVDVDAERLELAHAIGEKLVTRSGRRWVVEASTDRQPILPGCDYVINAIEVAGLRNVRPDYEIPLKYGVDQCIGDTIGPGGIFKMLRAGPTWLEIVLDTERICPQAVVMNYTNPMSALTLLALRASRVAVVGLCHSVQSTSRQLAGYLGLNYEDLRWRCAGVNHMAWFTELTSHGEDQYPRLRQAAQNPQIYEADPIRFEVMLHLGAFVTESSGHFSEYVPYFRKRPDLIQRYARSGYRGESGFYAHNWPRWRKESDEAIRAQLRGDSEVVLHRSSEYASYLVEAIETGRPAVIYGNVLNRGLIDNLPSSGCVEVPVLVDATGLHPTHFGALPHPLAALNAAHMYVHELMVESVLQRRREAALQALLLDPLTAAVCSPDEIRRMFDEMWAAERADLAYFEQGGGCPPAR
jgi:alpha-galactosidase